MRVIDAGLADEDGYLYRPLGTGNLIKPPSVALDVEDDALHWEVAERDTWQPPNGERMGNKPGEQLGLAVYDWEVVEPPDTLLLDFINLELDVDILSYAKRWGVLGVEPTAGSTSFVVKVPKPKSRWKPGTRVKRPKRRWRPVTLKPECVGPEIRDGYLSGGEPLALWREAIAQALALVKIKASLQGGQPASIEQWRAVVGYNTEYILAVVSSEKDKKDSLEIQRREVARVVNYCWLNRVNVRPVLLWQKSPDNPEALPRVLLAPDQSFTLYATLACQLMAALVGARPFATCSYCGRFFHYPSGKAPKRGYKTWCPDRRECQAAKTKGKSKSDTAI